MNPMPSRSSALVAVLLMVLGVSLFAIGDAVTKHLIEALSVFQIVALRGAFSVAVMLPLLARTHGLNALTTRRPLGHLLRVMIGWVEMTCFFLSLRTVPLAEATALFFTAPLFMTALSVPLLREKVGIRRWGAVLVGFAGVVIVLRPGSSAFEPNALLALTAGILYALMMIATRWLGRTESAFSLTFSMVAGSAVLSALAAPFAWSVPSPQQWLALAGLGIIAAIAHFALAEAFRRAPVSLIAPFEYTAIVWATACGYLFWNEFPDLWTWLGILTVVASGICVLYREIRRRREAESAVTLPSSGGSASAPTP